MKLRIVLLLLFLLTNFASTIASAETETTVSDDAESFNLAGLYHPWICHNWMGVLSPPLGVGHLANNQKGKKPLHCQESSEMQVNTSPHMYKKTTSFSPRVLPRSEARRV